MKRFLSALLFCLTTLTFSTVFAADGAVDNKALHVPNVGSAKTLLRQRFLELEAQEQELEHELEVIQQQQSKTIGLESLLFLTAIAPDRYALHYLHIDRPEPLLLGAGFEMDTQQTFGNNIPTSSTLQPGTTTNNPIENTTKLTHFEIVSAYATLNDWTHMIVDVQDAGGTAGFRNAMIILGDLKKKPWYVSVGRTRIDFQYFVGNAAYTNTLANQVFRTGFDDPQFTLGYFDKTISNTFTIYQPKGMTHSSFADLLVLRHDFSPVHALLNFGYIDDVRGTGSGFSSSIDQFNQTTGRTGMFTTGLNLHYDIFTVFGMFETSLQEQAITQNKRLNSYTYGVSALPKVYGHDSNFTISMTHMNNAQQITSVVPSMVNGAELTGIKTNLLAFYSFNVTDKIILTLEYNWDKTYNDLSTNALTLDFMAFI